MSNNPNNKHTNNSDEEKIVPLFHGYVDDSRIRRDHPSLSALPSADAPRFPRLLSAIAAVFNEAGYLPDSPWEIEDFPWV